METAIKEEECVELKNLKYKTMLLSGVVFKESKSTANDLCNLEKFLEDNKNNTQIEPWSKLDKTLKTKKLLSFAETYAKDKDLTSIPIIKNIYNKIRTLFELTPKDIDKHSPETLAAGLLKILFIGILKEKPGIGGYIANVKENGELQWFKVTEESIKDITDDKILAKAAVNASHSFLKIKPEIFF